MLRNVTPLILAVLLAACAGDDWAKPGADEAALNRDRGECAALAPPAPVQEQAPPYPSDQPGADMGSAGLNGFGAVQTSEALNRMDVDVAFIDRCMASKGWTKT